MEWIENEQRRHGLKLEEMSYTLRWQRLEDGSIIATDGSLWDPDEPEIEDWFTEYYWKAIRDL